MDPSFKFDIGASEAIPAPQAPWEFSGAAISANEDRSKLLTTSIDQKIRRIKMTRDLARKASKEGNGAPKAVSSRIIGSKRVIGRHGGDGGRQQYHGDPSEGDDDEKDEDEDSDDEAEKEDDMAGSEQEAQAGEEEEEEEEEEGEEEEEDDDDDERTLVVHSEEEEEEDDDDEEEDDDDEDDVAERSGSEEDNGEAKAGGSGGGITKGSKDGIHSRKDGRGANLETQDDDRSAEERSSSDASESDDDEEEEEGDVRKNKRTANRVPKVVCMEVGPGKKGNGTISDEDNFFASSEGASFTAHSFSELNLSRPLIRACEALGYERPTPIQAACIPLALTGRDICGSAITGSGKTAAFGLPVLERLLFRPRRIAATRVLVITPTRELAVQVHSMIEKLAQFTDIRSCLVVGGLSNKMQETALRTRPDIVVATPGRMIDHLHNAQSVGLEDLAVLILDEADRLLGMGFTKEIHELVSMCPRKRQTLLFSATMTEDVAELINLSLNNPIRLAADPRSQRPLTLTEEVVKVKPSQEGDKEAILLAICFRSFRGKTIIFSQTKIEAHRLKLVFGLAGLKAAELHGNLSQTMRLEALESFRKQEADFLIATDVAARGLDIVGVETVINFDCPRDITQYIHRVGRTARAGRKGCAVTLITEKDRGLLKAMAKRASGQLKNRVVATPAMMRWRAKIEAMEKDIISIGSEEREERSLRKAEMEANKAQNMIEYADDIYSRPKKVWFQTTRERKASAEAAKAEKDGPVKKLQTLAEADALKEKEKRKREREKNMTRKQRRRLEARKEEAEDMATERAAAEDDDDDDDEQSGGEEDGDGQLQAEGGKGKRRPKQAVKEDAKPGRKLEDIGYRRAKAAKAELKHVGPGRTKAAKREEKLKRQKKKRKESREGGGKAAEDGEGGGGAKIDAAVRRQGESRSPSSSRAPRALGVNKSKPRMASRKSFKSKSRYKRRK